MARLFEELDNRDTPMGELSLRRRRIPALGDNDIWEVKLGDEFLMSSLFVRAEQALAERGLARVTGQRLRVVVGGLGLGYTAAAALTDSRISELVLVEALEPVIDWHRRGLLPASDELNGDPRCQYRAGDFFQLAAEGLGERCHAILLDIDHSPTNHLSGQHAGFYSPAKLRRMAAQLHPGGVFAMWSNDPPAPSFEDLLYSAFTRVENEVVHFQNPFQGTPASNTIYIAS